MDIFGIVVVAAVTALGGGSLRDLILGARPVFWVSDPAYILVTTIAALLTFIAGRFWELHSRLLVVADAFGLAAFTVIGAQKALDAGVARGIVVLMGVLTGVAGGMVRDVLCGEIPLILRKEVYATASLLGALVFVALMSLGLSRPVLLVVSMLTILLVRLAAIRWGLSLPVFSADEPSRSRRQD